MKKLFASLIMAAAAVAITGCSSLEIAQKFNGVSVTPTGNVKPLAQMTYNNYGFYMFNCVPFFSGAVSDPGSFALFTDTVTTENAVLELTRRAVNLGGTKVINITTSTSSAYQWYTLLFWSRSVSVSGTVIE